MYQYKIDVMQKLKERGYNTYTIKQSGALSQGTLTKLKNNGNITLDTLNTLCIMLKCQPSDIIEIIPTDEEKIKYF